MTPIGKTNIRVDLARIRRNAVDIGAKVGVPVWAVVKADAYGLGATSIVEAIADVVAGFCVFEVREAVACDLWRRTGKPAMVLGPPTDDVETYRRLHLRPCISTKEQAIALRQADPILNVDTGMQRFSCSAEQVDAVLSTGACREAMTHAAKAEQAIQLQQMLGGRNLVLHAAASALLNEPSAWLDLVRPGLALYRGAVVVSTPLVELHETRGPAGYSGFSAERHGIILRGYQHGLRPGICRINGQPRRLLEVGMQTAFVEVGPSDRLHNEVVLLGDGLTETDVANAWKCTPHEALLRLVS